MLAGVFVLTRYILQHRLHLRSAAAPMPTSIMIVQHCVAHLTASLLARAGIQGQGHKLSSLLPEATHGSISLHSQGCLHA